MKYKTGMIVEGKVTGIQPYGAFVNSYGKDLAAGNMFALYLSYAYQDKQ